MADCCSKLGSFLSATVKNFQFKFSPSRLKIIKTARMLAPTGSLHSRPTIKIPGSFNESVIESVSKSRRVLESFSFSSLKDGSESSSNPPVSGVQPTHRVRKAEKIRTRRLVFGSATTYGWETIVQLEYTHFSIEIFWRREC